MTSAARPTWSAALSSGGGLRDGSSSAPTLQTCAKDQPGHLKLKLRKFGQDAPEEIRSNNFRNGKTISDATLPLLSNFVSGDSDIEIDDDISDKEEAKGKTSNNNNTMKTLPNLNESETENIYFENDIEDGINGIGEDDDDDEEELMRELEKIRNERDAEKLAKEKKAAESDPHTVLSGNPLLSMTAEASVFGAKRRWDDDVVFKNQAKGLDEKPEKRFINDTTRSDFHRRFMDKFIK
jgi:protein CWC15